MCRRTALLALALLLAPLTPAQSGPVCPVPDPASSTVPACLRVVGSAGIADPVGAFTVNVMCDPVTVLPGVTVTLTFAPCTDISICTDQLDPGKTVACGPGVKEISGVTDAFGDVTFTVIGGGSVTDFGSPSCMVVTAGVPPVLLGFVAVSAFNLDGAAGVGANDLSMWFVDFASGEPRPRSDYDCTGAVGANDFSFWLTTFASGASAGGCAAVSCP